MTRYLVAASAITLLVFLGSLGESTAFDRYNDGCQGCHGAFTDATSTKGSVFPGDDKHTMHRSNGSMNAECNLCHSSGDSNNPYIGSSDGTSNNPGIGCNGCHDASGLRAHHLQNAVESCSFCHTGDPTPPAENVNPVYYDTPDSNVTSPCNDGGLPDSGENWTIGDLIGTDNDGDNLYDAADPDCAAAGTPGEVGTLLVSAHDRASGNLTISYNPACSSSDSNYYFGSLSQVATLAYSGQTCGIGNSGSHVWNYSAVPGSAFFLVVGNDTAVEGSYGASSGGSERPEAAVCPEPQDLSQACN